MPEEEGQQKKAESQESSSGGFLNTRGWIVVVVAEILTVLGFVVYLHLRDSYREKDKTQEEEVVRGEDQKYYNKYFCEMADLNYSIPTPGGSSKMLSMKLVIMLGRTREERQKDVEVVEEDWAKFKGAVESMNFKIRDNLNQYIRQQSGNQLESQSGQEKIRQRVKEFVNQELKYIRFEGLSKDDLSRERVADVLIQDFFIQ